MVLTAVYATGARAPGFTALRLALVFGGLCLLTIPVPLILFYRLERGRSLLLAVGALYVLAVIPLGLVRPTIQAKGSHD